MAYEVAFKPSAFRSLANLPKPAQKRILVKIESLAEKPFPPGVKKLKGEEDLYRIRAGDYRVIYQVQSELLLVLVVRIGHRKEIYQ
jgi:mRNA interferase RelE/StbE